MTAAWFAWSVTLLYAGDSSAAGLQVQGCPKTPNCVSSLDRDESHYVRPVSFDGPADQAWMNFRKAVLEEPRSAVVWEGSTVFRAESTSLIFGFVDDLVFEVVPNEAIIHVRSASRVGYWDLGVNRRRVERIRARFSSLQAGR